MTKNNSLKFNQLPLHYIDIQNLCSEYCIIFYDDSFLLLQSIIAKNQWLNQTCKTSKIKIGSNIRPSPLFFVQRRMRFLILGRSVGLKKKTEKTKSLKKSWNRRPWYPSMTLKVYIHIFGFNLTKCTIYCKKCSCFCFCFSLCFYYAHFSD